MNRRQALLLVLLTLSACSAPPCSNPAAMNKSQCPGTWADAKPLCGTPCGEGALDCSYPGAGDQVGGCFATAVLGCAGGSSAADAGAVLWQCGQ